MKLIGWIFAFTLVSPAFAQLPVIRLHEIFPSGGQVGSTVEVSIAGADLDDANQLVFSHTNITAQVKTNETTKFAVSIGLDVAPGVCDVRVAGAFGLSNPRSFAVGNLTETNTTAKHQNPTNALEIPLNTTINARAEAGAVAWYKFTAKNGDRITIQCAATELDSRMRPVLTLHSAGLELARSRQDGLISFTATNDAAFLVKVHDLLYRGGTEYIYRLTVSTKPQMEPKFHRQILSVHVPTNATTAPLVAEREPNSKPEDAQKLTAPCEVAGQFSSAGDPDWFTFDAKKGEVFWIEAFSHRLGYPTDPFVLVQRLTKNDKGEIQASDLQELYDTDANIGGTELRTNTRDPAWRLEVKEDGSYRVQVRDLFNHSAKPPPLYRLAIRKEAPDFQLIALPQTPRPLKQESKDIPLVVPFLRRAETMPIKVLALRRDNFGGAITVTAEGLPPGVAAPTATVDAGKNSTALYFTADDNCGSWHGAIRIIGKASVAGAELKREAHPATFIRRIDDRDKELVESRLAAGFALGVTDRESFPVSIAPVENKVWEATAGAKLQIPLKIVRRGEFNEAFKLKVATPSALEALKEFEVPASGTNATLEIDLGALKVSAGTHRFALQTQTKGKYTPPATQTTPKPGQREATITVHSAPIEIKVIDEKKVAAAEKK